MLQRILNERGLLPLLSRDEMLDILQKEEYGYLPPVPDKMSWTVTERLVRNFCAGHASLSRVDMHCEMGNKSFDFPIYCTLPVKEGKHPFFILINFRDDVPDRYMPSEELIDNGYGVISLCYKDVTSDDADFTNGLAGVLFENGERTDTDCGKIAMWAWAAQRALDYALTLDCVDASRVTVCGHSRLGKTALLAAATDERFFCGYSNDSGCSGAAITRNKQGETVKNICNKFGYWFCKNYFKYIDNEDKMPFDQHYLIASIAPRYACVGSASEDIWADPDSEMLACVAASPAFKGGFVSKNRLPVIGDKFFDGDIGYQLREGSHYFSRTDWLRLIEFLNKKYER